MNNTMTTTPPSRSSQNKVSIHPRARAPSQPWITVESVSADLSPFIDDLDITEDEENIVVMPKRYLGRKRFSEIAELMRELGGNYVSAGKESKFLIPKREAEID